MKKMEEGSIDWSEGKFRGTKTVNIPPVAYIFVGPGNLDACRAPTCCNTLFKRRHEGGRRDYRHGRQYDRGRGYRCAATITARGRLLGRRQRSA